MQAFLVLDTRVALPSPALGMHRYLPVGVHVPGLGPGHSAGPGSTLELIWLELGRMLVTPGLHHGLAR